MSLQSKRFSFDKLKSGGLHEEHAIAVWDLGTILRMCLKTEENQDNVCRAGRTQDPQDKHRLLTGPLATKGCTGDWLKLPYQVCCYFTAVKNINAFVTTWCLRNG